VIKVSALQTSLDSIELTGIFVKENVFPFAHLRVLISKIKTYTSYC